MDYVLPMLIIRSDVPSLIEVNGRLQGEIAPDGYLAMPLSDTGDYYVCAIPLMDDRDVRRFSVTRKLSLNEGALTSPIIGDVDLCTWPGGVYEMKICPGSFQADRTQAFPYTICVLEWQREEQTHTITLYYENGLRLSAEEQGRVIAGYSLGDGTGGTLSLLDVGDDNLLLVRIGTRRGERMLALDFNLSPLLEIEGDTVYVDEGCPSAVKRLDTLLKHEERTRYEYRDGQFLALSPEIGFFTHPPERPGDNLSLAIAFCEAVRENQREEALSYLASDLVNTLNFDDIRSFFGDFSCCRPTFSDRSGKLLGLIYQSGEQLKSAQLFSFEFENGLISDVSEY
ncbi:MAG: hypothetical protein AAGU74_10655 [Bacillota bacterium]